LKFSRHSLAGRLKNNLDSLHRHIHLIRIFYGYLRQNRGDKQKDGLQMSHKPANTSFAPFSTFSRNTPYACIAN